MIQKDPAQRLGNNPESIKELKRHPFFNDIDFDEVSDKGYTGVIDRLKVKIT